MEDNRWVERYHSTCKVEVGRARVDGHPLSTHVVVFTFPSGTRNTKVSEAVSQGQTSGRLGDDIARHLPQSCRVRSQQETRLACRINSEVTGGFHNSKYDSPSTCTRWIASEVPLNKSLSQDWRAGFFPVADRPRT